MRIFNSSLLMKFFIHYDYAECFSRFIHSELVAELRLCRIDRWVTIIPIWRLSWDYTELTAKLRLYRIGRWVAIIPNWPLSCDYAELAAELRLYWIGIELRLCRIGVWDTIIPIGGVDFRLFASLDFTIWLRTFSSCLSCAILSDEWLKSYYPIFLWSSYILRSWSNSFL